MTDYLDALLDLEAVWQATEENALEAVLTALGRTEPAGGRGPGALEPGRSRAAENGIPEGAEALFRQDADPAAERAAEGNGAEEAWPRKLAGTEFGTSQEEGTPLAGTAETVLRTENQTAPAWVRQTQAGRTEGSALSGLLRRVEQAEYRPAPAAQTVLVREESPEGRTPDLESLDRRFQRDARRYDAGFRLF